MSDPAAILVGEDEHSNGSVRDAGHMNTEARTMVELRGVSKSFGDVAALDDVSLSIRDGEFFTLLGPSGSGKTTVLRIVAGLIEPDNGEILIGGTSMRGVPTFERELAVVFQSLALFPHMSVSENIAFSLRMRRRSRTETAAAVREVLELVQLPDIGNRKITELSGGQRQRVALARSLIYKPRLLLLDEPLSALDRRLREDMQLELTRLHRELGVTIINVTHDQHEALFVSDRVALMNAGKVVQVGQGREIYDRPATEFVAAFLGDPVLLVGEVTSEHGPKLFTSGALRLQVEAAAPEGRATLLLRPERLRLLPEGADPAMFDNSLPGEVVFAAFDGTGIFVQVVLEGFTVSVHTTMRDTLEVAIGDRVQVAWNAGDAAVIPKEAT
jgi:putative spermidine/putrescine transport system ATP-binding protein